MGAESRFSTPTYSVVSQSISISLEKWSREKIGYKIGLNVQNLPQSRDNDPRPKRFLRSRIQQNRF